MGETKSNLVVRTENLTKIYGSGDTAVRAVDNICMSVHAGEFLAIVGASGSGKSTLLHLIGTMDKPTSGKVFVDEIEITSSTSSDLAVFRRRKVGFVFQFYNLVSVLNVRDNILLPLNLDGQKADMAHFNDIVKTLGLSNLLDTYPHHLSGGQQQRVSIARAIMAKPAVILADEPTGNLDTQNTREVIAMFRRSISKYRQTLILVTHDPNVASEADRTVTLSDGRIIGA